MNRIVTGITVVCWIQSAHAAAHRVPSEYPTINAALDASVSGDSVLVAPGTYTDYETRLLQGGGPFTASSAAFLKGGVSLIGEGGSSATRIDLMGQGVGDAVPVLAYDAAPGVIVVQGLTITGAPVENAGIWSLYGERMVIRDCVLEGLDGGSRGPGGIHSIEADLEVYDSEFRSCRAGYNVNGHPWGAAIESGEEDAVVENCVFSECVGPRIVRLDGRVSPSTGGAVRDCRFLNNEGTPAFLTGFASLTVEDCAFVGNASTTGPGGLWVNGPGTAVPYVARRNLFARNESAGLGTVLWESTSGTFEENTIVGSGTYGLVLKPQVPQPMMVRRNVIASTTGAVGALFLSNSGAPPPISECNVFWNNPNGNTQGYSLGPTDRIIDPQFCDEVAGDYTLRSTSPCLAANSAGCGQIGALGLGCGVISLEPETWARTKVKYRGDAGRREQP